MSERQDREPFPEQGDSEPHEERWRQLARQASSETDATRLLQLVKELIEERDRVESRRHAK
jgi:hypothetical protein